MIHIAVKNNNLEMIELLVNAGADINARRFGTYPSPLQCAIEDKKFECFKKLIELGANLEGERDTIKYRGTNEMIQIFNQYVKGDPIPLKFE